MYTALSKGDIDVLSSSWQEQDPRDVLGDGTAKDLEDLGVYYEGATLFLAVPTYSDINSIDELPSDASEFGDQIVGIEPGAGLTKTTKDNVFPDVRARQRLQAADVVDGRDAHGTEEGNGRGGGRSW